MIARPLVRTASTLIAALILGGSINACSSAQDPERDHSAANSDSLRGWSSGCAPFLEPVVRLNSTYCDATTAAVCAATPAPHTCGATLPSPVAGCTAGMTITNTASHHRVNVWACANGTPIPTSLGPIGDGGEAVVGHIDASQPFCSNCVGALQPGYFFLLQWQTADGIGGGCSGPCALGAGNGHP